MVISTSPALGKEVTPDLSTRIRERLWGCQLSANRSLGSMAVTERLLQGTTAIKSQPKLQILEDLALLERTLQTFSHSALPIHTAHYSQTVQKLGSNINFEELIGLLEKISKGSPFKAAAISISTNLCTLQDLSGQEISEREQKLAAVLDKLNISLRSFEEILNILNTEFFKDLCSPRQL